VFYYVIFEILKNMVKDSEELPSQYVRRELAQYNGL